MAISARNKLCGKIEEIQLGDIMAHVVVPVGENLIESATPAARTNSSSKSEIP
jgi:molybdopterin-binding protein